MFEISQKNKNSFLSLLSYFFIFKPSSYSQKNLKIFKGVLKGFSKGVKGLIFGVFFCLLRLFKTLVSLKSVQWVGVGLREGAGDASQVEPRPLLIKRTACFYVIKWGSNEAPSF
ncbi:hypothetical protein BKH41_02770 [Helicobacter sp. 12S02232-10]|uniref:hypothetical protein n=1 Tax=Helicobacter sp. 12S02232-10 TaxID=1476197 RepID=UPI000BA789B3|nr:hypothetical protein [Helicobacter sp. 12S02232-10]PAF49604.1 hypothetical protein BKH41_02770 [Helicobacter sp. 12S02232-10]